MRRALASALVALLAPLALGGCGAADDATLASAPNCASIERVGLIAQSVPSSSYLPCITELPTGWQSSGLIVQNGSTRFRLLSDRAQGRAVRITFRRGCDPSAGAPIPPRTPGGRTYLSLRSIDPRYAGTLFDVFPGGCVTYRFDFRRGPHIALMAQLQAAVGFVSRAELDLALQRSLGVEVRR